MRLLTQLLALVIGLIIGFQLPDLDQRLPFLVHRSIITHGLLIPLGLFWLVWADRSWRGAGIAGLALATAVHLAFDLFPVAWLGYALITLPFVGSIGAAFSMLWLALSIIVCCALVLRLAVQPEILFAIVPIGLISFIIAARNEQVGWLMPLLVLVVAFLVARILFAPKNKRGRLG